MLHHDRTFIESSQAERRAAGELARIVPAAAAGNPAAWSAIVERFGARLRAVAAAHHLRRHDTEDVVQTTWLRLLEHIHDLREPMSIGAWLETTARRESLRTLTAGRREQPVEAEVAIDEPAAPVDEGRLAAAERRTALDRALRELRPREQRLLAMLVMEPRASYAEISRALGMPVGSIGPTRQRCLARLRVDGRLAGAVGDQTA